MNKTLIIFGNITFDEMTDGTPCAIVHEITETLLAPKGKAGEIADSLVNIYDAYVIPAEYDGKIIYE